MTWKGKPFGWGLPKPYLGFLPEPGDASINLLRDLTVKLAARDVRRGRLAEDHA